MLSEPITCTPKPKNRRALLLVIILALAGLVLFVTGPLVMQQYSFGAQLAAMLLLVLAVLFLFKYQLNTNVYILTPGQSGRPVFLIQQKQGKQTKTVCQLPLGRILAVHEVDAEHPAPQVDSKDDFSYLATMGAKNYQVLRARGNRGLLTVRIEADEAFMAVLREEFAVVLREREEAARIAKEKAQADGEEED